MTAPRSQPLTASIVITTKNRKDDLRRALASACAQTIPCEVLVVDDGSTDGTAAMVTAEFPTVRLVRHEMSCGYIVRRNEAARLVDGDVIVSIDDDAAFSAPTVVADTLREFDEPRVGAVAIPFVNVRQDAVVNQSSPEPGAVYVTSSYIGTAHAIRRALFLESGGYREFLFHQGEESDLAIRLLDRGYVVRLGAADPIHHFESPLRDTRRMDVYGPRNLVLFTWYNVPQPYFLPHLLVTAYKGFRHGMRVGRPLRPLQGLLAGLYGMVQQLGARQPARAATYHLFRKLRKSGAVPFHEVGPLLRPVA